MNKAAPPKVKPDWLERQMMKLERYEEALKMIAGVEDSCGYTHGSQLIGMKEVTLAQLVLEGKDPHEALEEI